MPYKAAAVANRFVAMASEKGTKITLMKLLKLVYFAHGWYWAIREESLLDERIEAWKFGPVSPSVYHAFKSNGGEPIKRQFQSLEMSRDENGKASFCFVTPTVPEDNFMVPFFETIWSVYGDLTAYQLSELTHQAGTPWHTTWFELGGSTRKGTDISDDLIKEYFTTRLNSANAG